MKKKLNCGGITKMSHSTAHGLFLMLVDHCTLESLLSDPPSDPVRRKTNTHTMLVYVFNRIRMGPDPDSLSIHTYVAKKTLGRKVSTSLWNKFTKYEERKSPGSKRQ